jgi:hypothetical protein
MKAPQTEKKDSVVCSFACPKRLLKDELEEKETEQKWKSMEHERQHWVAVLD